MTEQPALRLVNADGEIVDEHPGCPNCLRAEDEIDGLNRELRAWRARYADLARDVEKEARKHPLYNRAEELFDEWRRLTGHLRSKWSPDRFQKVRPFLKSDGYDLCLLAIQGAAFDPYTKARSNGSIKRFDDWELAFKDRGKFEEFCNRAPQEALADYKAKQHKEPDASTA